MPLSRTLDHVGPLAASVTDAWHVFHALAGRSMTRPFATTPRGRATLRRPAPVLLRSAGRGRAHGAFDAAVERLQTVGSRRRRRRDPHALISSRRSIVHIVFGDAAAYHADALDTMPERYTTPVRLRLEMARYVLAEDYVRALAGREVLTTRSRRARLPATTRCSCQRCRLPRRRWVRRWSRSADRRKPVRNLMLRLTQLFNITGHPAISLPNGTQPVGPADAGCSWSARAARPTPCCTSRARSKPFSRADVRYGSFGCGFGAGTWISGGPAGSGMSGGGTGLMSGGGGSIGSGGRGTTGG